MHAPRKLSQGGIALACLAAWALGACGEATDAASSGGTPEVFVDGTPETPVDRWRVQVKRLAESDAGAPQRLIVDRTVQVDGQTIKATGFAVREAFLPAGTGPMYIHAVGLAGEVPVVVADGSIGSGQGEEVRVAGWLYDAACDTDADTFRDCSNVQAACCASIPNQHRGELGDCLDAADDVPTPERPDRKRRDAALTSPFAPTESADDYLVCDNQVDDDCAGGDVACGDLDADGDGTTVAGDCDDADADIHPGAYDNPGDGVDQDCDGQDGGGTDADNDGWLADDLDEAKRDCDDENPQIHPQAGEITCDAIDQDCVDGDICVADGDVDGDGSVAPEDCDDHDSGRRPGRRDLCGDGIDQDCDGEDLACPEGDADKDGFVAPEDCDDANPAAHPGAPEACGNGADENCDGRDPSCREVEDGDGDSYSLPDDCDDRNADVHPGVEERCNNRDDDCDGVVDEGNPRLFDGSAVPHEATCGRDEGACRMGPLVCAHTPEGTVFDLCLGDMGSEELCDGFDNDCDGLTDVLNGGMPMSDEGQQPCGPELERGACVQGRLFCRAGSLSDCRGATEPSEETCNGTDDDCDGVVDDGPGGEDIFVSCYSGPAGTEGVGECRVGLQRCVEGQLAACDGEVVPTDEVCDGFDNDCNGATDDEIVVPCWDFEPGKRGIGACRDGHRECVAGMLGECLEQVAPTDEICDGLDNNCDRIIDQFNEPCYEGPPDTIGPGRPCHEGLRVCNNGQYSACMGQVLPLPAELCDSQDNNCDGRADESFDFTSDPLHCGSCDVECRAGQACCNRACRDVNSLQNCGGCDVRCGRGADGCRDLGGGEGPQCACGQGPACLGDLACIGGSCLCQSDDDCGDDELCCGGRCEATSPEAGGQCAACDDGGCNPTLANNCAGRECLCGENTACQEGNTVCGQRNGQGAFLCLGCRDNAQCGAREICCQQVCDPVNPDFQCEGCGIPCDRERADTCMTIPLGGTDHDTRCVCGASDAPCDPNGGTPWCVDGICEECRTDADCHEAGRGQCVDHVCRACDPGDHAGCAANDLCCGFQCSRTGPAANQQCTACGTACDTETTDTCTGRACRCGNNPPCSGATPHCDDARDVCVECLIDGDCANDPDGGQCVGNVCRRCDPNGHDGCAGNEVCCGAGQPGVYRCEATGPGAGEQCEACDDACVTSATNRCNSRTCACGNGAPCSGATPVCDDARGLCVDCVVDADCTPDRHPGAGQCVNNICRPCDPGDHAGCNGSQLCCGFQCTATGGGAGQQCETCNIACGTSADTCQSRDCVCGSGPGAVECGGNLPYCLDGSCQRCRNNNDCGANELCCNNACTPTGPAANQQCQACGQACTLSNSNLCTNRSCMCGNNNACGGQTPVCDDARGVCVQCLIDGDCPNNGQCVANVCRACDPGDHAGCAANQLCCNFQCQATGAGVGGQCEACGVACSQDSTNICTNRDCRCGNNAECGGQTAFCNDGPGTCTGCRNDNDCGGGTPACVAGTCRACDPADDQGCTANSNTPVCGNNFQCRACADDGECADNATGTFCNPQVGRCRRCNAASDQPCELTLPICDEVDNRCEDCANDGECLSRPGAEDQCVAGDCRACDPTAGQGNAGCTGNSNTPVCSAATFTCRGCQADAECAGNAAGTVCYEVAGRCGQCDPANNTCQGATPVCDANTLTCRACQGDNDCQGANGQCVGGSCRRCDPANDDGCDKAGTSPHCDSAAFTCESCNSGEAADTGCANNPNGTQCITSGGSTGACKGCDPGDDAGCNAAGNTPNCNAGFTCEACTAQAGDAGCAGNPTGGQCVPGGSCKACDPANSDGCTENSATPVCDPGNFTCRACQAPALPADADQECVTRTGALNQCVDGRCRGCDPLDDEGCTLNGNFPNCNAVSFSCVACGDDTGCAGNPNGAQCVAGGSCKLCDPVQSDGCTENSATPICDGGNFACRACGAGAGGDAECNTRTGTADQCVTGRCRDCDPTGNVDCDANGVEPVCDGTNFVCRGCGGDGECVGNGNGGQCIAAGSCEACDTVGNAGCDPASATPICGAANNTCRACAVDNECTGNANGEQCITGGGDQGECHACDPANDAPCGADICVNYACVDCSGDPSCANNGNGDYCVSGDCEECTAAAQCPPGRVCTANVCAPCLANADCTGHPDGNLCDAAVNGGTCRTCTTNQDCRDHGFGNTATCNGSNQCIP